MKTDKLAKARVKAIQDLIDQSKNGIHNWSELARRLRPNDEAGQGNMLQLFSRIKRAESPQLLGMRWIPEIAAELGVSPDTIYIHLNEGEEAPAVTVQTLAKPASTKKAAKKANPIIEGYLLEIRCPQLGIDIKQSITYQPLGSEGPCFGSLEGGTVIEPAGDSHHHKMRIGEISMNGSTLGPLVGLVHDRHKKLQTT